jgi:hypothetical protein
VGGRIAQTIEDVETGLGGASVLTTRVGPPEPSLVAVAFSLVGPHELVRFDFETSLTRHAQPQQGLPTAMSAMLGSIRRISPTAVSREANRVDVGRVSFVLPRGYSPRASEFTYDVANMPQVRVDIVLTSPQGFAQPHWSWEDLLYGTDDVVDTRRQSSAAISRDGAEVGMRRTFSVSRRQPADPTSRRDLNMEVREAWVRLGRTSEAHVMMASPVTFAGEPVWLAFLASIHPGS